MRRMCHVTDRSPAVLGDVHLAAGQLPIIIIRPHCCTKRKMRPVITDLRWAVCVCLTQPRTVQNSYVLELIHTATPGKTRPSRLPVDRRRRDAGQTGSYA